MFQFPAFNTEVNTFKVFDKWGRGDYNCCVRKISVTEILCVGGVVRYHWQTVNCTYLNYKMFAFWYTYFNHETITKIKTVNISVTCKHPLSVPLGIPSFYVFPCWSSQKHDLLSVNADEFAISGILYKWNHTVWNFFGGGLAFFIQHIHFDIYLHCCVYQ